MTTASHLAAKLGMRIDELQRWLDAGLTAEQIESCAKFAMGSILAFDDICDMTLRAQREQDEYVRAFVANTTRYRRRLVHELAARQDQCLVIPSDVVVTVHKPSAVYPEHEMILGQTLTDLAREYDDSIVIEVSDPGAPVDEYFRDILIGPRATGKPWSFWQSPHLGTIRRSKRHTSLGVAQ